MTDRELLELAAKAAGISLQWDNEGTAWIKWPSFKWNPLEDDGDALRLAVKLAFINPGCFPSPSLDMERMIHTGETPDWYAATRRAIVRAAAELGRAK